MSSGYENAPATKMLATHCACCGRPLVDSISVETGVGPECRKRHGYDIDVPQEIRQEANKLVYIIALDQTGPRVIESLLRLRDLGFTQLSDRIAERLNCVRITEVQDTYAVKAPYRDEAVRAFASIPGRRWEREHKHNTFPLSERKRIWDVLKTHYAGMILISKKGMTTI
jgi:hypothetical protein